VEIEGRSHMRLHIGREGTNRRALEHRYAELWAQFEASFVRLVNTYESVPQAREDLLQDIRVAIWMALPRFREESSLRTFAFRIAHNRALTHVWRRRPTEVLDDLEIPDNGNDPEAIAIGSIEQDRFNSAIRSLPVPMMQVITLTLEDIPQREIAEILGISENNVAVRLNRARGLLRQKLGGRS